MIFHINHTAVAVVGDFYLARGLVERAVIQQIEGQAVFQKIRNGFYLWLIGIGFHNNQNKRVPFTMMTLNNSLYELNRRYDFGVMAFFTLFGLS